MANRDPKQCAKAVQGFWNNERELIRQGQGTRDWSVQEQIEIMNFKPSGGERKNAAAPTYGRGQATEYGMNYDRYEGQHMKSAEAHPDFQGDPGNIQALTRSEHQQAHSGDFRNPTNGYYDPRTGKIADFGDSPAVTIQPRQLSEAYAETAEYQYIVNSLDSPFSAYEQKRSEMQSPANDNAQDIFHDFEQNKADLQNPEQDNFGNVLNDFEAKKAEMQDVGNQQNDVQAMTEAETEASGQSVEYAEGASATTI